MAFKLTNLKPRHGGFTLVEVMVVAAVGCLVLLAAGSFFLFSLRGFAAISNYAVLNSRSRNASDLLSRDIRCALSVASASTNQLVLNEAGGQVAYVYDPRAHTLTRTQGTAKQALLSQVDSLSFSLCQRPATNAAFNVFPVATNVASAKLVSFQWSCSRLTPGSHSDSESIQTALVSLRNE